VGLTYDSGDSGSVKSALSGNLRTAQSALDAAERATDRLVAALGTGELSGKGYSAVDALFSQIIAPCLSDAKSEIDDIQRELDTFTFEDSKISRYGVLKEDELNIQLIATRTQRDATESLREANRAAANTLIAVPMLGDALRAVDSRLELVLTQLENDIRDLEDKLHAVRSFHAATRGLFRDSLEKLAAATRDTVALLKRLNDTDGGLSLVADLSAGLGAFTSRRKALQYLAGLGSSKDWTSATPGELSSLLRDLSPSQMKAMLATHPELLQRFWDHPPAPEKTAAWWNKLDAKQRKDWAKSVPRLIGNLDGVPPRVRSDANRHCLTDDLAAAKKRLKAAKADPELGSQFAGVRQAALNRLAEAEKLADTLSRIDIAYGAGPTGAVPHELYVYQPGERTKVAISTGLLETADHISVLVPGMGTTANDIGQYGNAARDMRQQQSQASGVDPSKIAVLSWLDYDPPGGMDVWGVTHDDLARAGAERLGNTLRGLTAVKDWPSQAAGLSVIAHSYGTNVATLALTGKEVSVGHVVLLGSAGVANEVASAGALHVPGGEVFAAEGAKDEWAGPGQFLSRRTDPTNPAFGAHTFSAENTVLDGITLEGITKHGPFGNSQKNPDSYSYLDNLTSAQYGSAMATMGRGQDLPVSGTPLDRSALSNPLPGSAWNPIGPRR
jgi:hypothetical protein